MSWPKISRADIEFVPKDRFACLSRNEKESISACFDENFICHQTLAIAAREKQTDWQAIVIASLAGAALAFAVDRIHH